MDPVTLVLGALTAGALKGADETATAAVKAVKAAYTALKAAVAARFTER